MGKSRAGRNSRNRTGGRPSQRRKKRAYERARAPAMTKLADRRARLVRVRGGNYKLRALRLNHGNFSWRSEEMAKKTRLLDVVYHPANPEHVRTKTLTKSAIVLIDATPFRVWYKNQFNIDLSDGEPKKLEFSKKMSQSEIKDIEKRQKKAHIPKNIAEQFKTGKLMAILMSKPGQVGKADGYILEEEELDFYLKKIAEKKKKK